MDANWLLGWAVTTSFVSAGWLLFFYAPPRAWEMLKVLPPEIRSGLEDSWNGESREAILADVRARGDLAAFKEAFEDDQVRRVARDLVA